MICSILLIFFAGQIFINMNGEEIISGDAGVTQENSI